MILRVRAITLLDIRLRVRLTNYFVRKHCKPSQAGLQTAWAPPGLSGLGPSYLPVDDRLPVRVHRLADLDGHLDLNLEIFSLVKL